MTTATAKLTQDAARLAILLSMTASLMSGSAFADGGDPPNETYIEISAPEDGTEIEQGDVVLFRVTGVLCNDTHEVRDAYWGAEIYQGFDTILEGLFYEGTLEPDECLTVGGYESISTRSFPLGEVSFSAWVGHHWKLAPEASTDIDIEVLADGPDGRIQGWATPK